MATTKQRLAKLERKAGIKPAADRRLEEAMGALMDALSLALGGEWRDCPKSLYEPNGKYLFIRGREEKVEALDVRRAANALTPEDKAVIATLPAEHLAVVGMTGEEFVAFSAEIERIL